MGRLIMYAAWISTMYYDLLFNEGTVGVRTPRNLGKSYVGSNLLRVYIKNREPRHPSSRAPSDFVDT